MMHAMPCRPPSCSQPALKPSPPCSPGPPPPTLQFKVLGYGELSLHVRLQLCAGPPRVDPAPLQVHCTPLELPPQLLLRPPPAGLMAGSAAEFYRGWATLPGRMELSGALAVALGS